MKFSAQSKAGLLLFLTTFLVFLVSVGRFINGDADMANFAAWHLVSTGSPWIENANVIQDHPLRHIWIVEVDGHEVVARAPGVIIANLPAYWLFRPSEYSGIPGGLTAAFLSSFSVLFVYLASVTRLSIKASVIAAVVFGFGSPVWAVAADAMWPHTITVFGITGMAWAAAKERWWLVGLFGGVALTGRVHAAVIVAVVGLGVAIVRRRPSVLVKTAIPSTAILGLTLVWNRWLYHSWNPTGGYQIDGSTDVGERYSSLLTNELGLWVAPDRGILIWTPIFIFMLPAVFRAWSDVPDWSKLLAFAGLIYSFLQGWANVFHGGDFFWSYRLGLEFVACATPLFAFSIPRLGATARKVVPIVAGFQILFIGIGAALSIPGLAASEAWSNNVVVKMLATEPFAAVGLLAVAFMVIKLITRVVGPVDDRNKVESDDSPAA